MKDKNNIKFFTNLYPLSFNTPETLSCYFISRIIENSSKTRHRVERQHQETIESSEVEKKKRNFDISHIVLVIKDFPFFVKSFILKWAQ